MFFSQNSSPAYGCSVACGPSLRRNAMNEHRKTSEGSSRRGFLKAAGLGAGVTALSGTSVALGMPLSSIAKASKHVLLISVDGLHAIDLERWIKTNPTSILALLSEKGVTYSQAYSRPTDSFPGLMSLVTGGSP